MLAPNHIQKELNLINEMYFCVYNSHIRENTSMSRGKSRWQIRKWAGIYPKSPTLWNESNSEPILTICKEVYAEDRGLYDAGYEDMDRRVIFAIRKSNWWKLDYKRKIAEMDWRNEKKERQADAQFEYESKYVAKRIWRGMHEPTVHLSGKEWRS